MNKLQVTELFNKAGYSIYWTGTGSSDWHRGFIQKPSGKCDHLGRSIPCRYGRISLNLGNVYNVKFYFRQSDARQPLNGSDYLIYFWSYYCATGDYLSRDIYDQIVKEATVRRDADLSRKLSNREKIEAEDKAKAKALGKEVKAKKRPSIKGRCVRRFIEDIIQEKKKNWRSLQ